jgi:hypothetical protein
MSKKIKKEELTKLQDLVKNYNQHQLKIGELEIEKHGLLHSVSIVQQDLQKFQEELREAYGDISIDINDGKIAKNEPSKED